MKRWWRKVRARKPGIYWYVTRRHLKPGTEIGYVGLSNRLDLRALQHVTKDWHDLVVRRRVVKLPWWLGWRWVLDPLETVAILAMHPRYNWLKNPRKDKVGPIGQRAERAQRDLMPDVERARIERIWRGLQFARALGVLCLIAAPVGYIITK